MLEAPATDEQTDQKAGEQVDEHQATTQQAPRKPRRWRRRLVRTAIVVVAAAAVFAALSQVFIPKANPAFPLSRSEARAEIDAMRADPVPLSRPVVIVTGWRSPPANGVGLMRHIQRATGAGDDRVLVWSDAFADDIDTAAADLVGLVESTWPSEPGSGATVEVDVIGISMGGLVSRTAARAPEGRGGDADDKRLAIRDLYTFGTPHRGSRLSQYVRVDTASAQMRPGSAYVDELNGSYENAGYTLTPYAALHDRWVGATRSAPPGEEPLWVSGRVVLSHHLITHDSRLIADLLRRLRDEPAYGSPSAPPRD